jgi:hypothetical protein
MFPEFTPKQKKRFWSYVDASAGPDECWPWIGPKQSMGYGRFVYGAGRQFLSHRLMYYFVHGDIPKHCVCHHCDNPICVNPFHLFAGTSKENGEDMARKKRSPYGVNRWNSKLDPDKVRQIRALCQNGQSWRSVAFQFGVTDMAVHKIMRGETWGHVSNSLDDAA